jgi:hypothetical protein
MRRMRVFIFTTMLLLTAGTTAYSDVVDVVDEWYTDSWFTSQVGYYEKFCDGSTMSSGTQSNFLYQHVSGCNSTYEAYGCFEWNGTEWVATTCPQDMAHGGRLRVPVG